MFAKIKQIELEQFSILCILGVFGYLDKSFMYFYVFGFLLFVYVYKKYSKYKFTDNKPRYTPKIIVFFFFYYVSTLLNPIIVAQSMLQAVGQLYIVIKNFAIFPNVNNHKGIEYCLPFVGTWNVAAGGIEITSSHSWFIVSQRYAYDFYILDKDMKSHKDSHKSLDNYYCYNQKIVAPADGTVIKVKNNVNDSKWIKFGLPDFFTTDFRGNFVVIKHSDNEYSMIAHFKKNSIVVKKGDIVKTGQLIGLCGNSGLSREPHIHFQIQNSPNFFFSVGLPVKFKNYKIINDREASDYIKADDIVQNLTE